MAMALNGHLVNGDEISRSEVSADNFVAMLRHLAEAHMREAKLINALLFQRSSSSWASVQRGRHPRLWQKPSTPVSRFQVLRARFEGALQDIQEFFASVSYGLCLVLLKCAHRLNHTTTHIWHSLGRGSNDGNVRTLTSLHWSLTCMTIQLQGLRHERSQRQRAVGDFVKRHHISVALATRVKRYIKRSQPQQIREDNVDSLRMCLAELLTDLQLELRTPTLSAHPFFCSLQAGHPHLVRELSQQALLPLLKFPDEIVFSAHTVCERMYFIVSGYVQYTIDASADERKASDSWAVSRRTLHGGQWLGEAALWTSWVHCGELKVITDSLLFVLDATGFARVISAHKVAHDMARRYAKKFVEQLNGFPQSDLVDTVALDQPQSS